MNLISVPKPAVGFEYTGTFQGIMELQQFVTSRGFTIQSMSFNASQDMLFDVAMSLTKPYSAEDESNVNYSALNARPNRTLVHPENATSLLVFTAEQLEVEYTVTEED